MWVSHLTPGPLGENSGGFRCIQGLRGQSVEPGVVGDRTNCMLSVHLPLSHTHTCWPVCLNRLVSDQLPN